LRVGRSRRRHVEGKLDLRGREQELDGELEHAMIDELGEPELLGIWMDSLAEAIEPSSRFMRSRHSYSSGSWLREVTIG